MKNRPVYIVGALLFGILLSSVSAQNANFGYVEEPINPRSTAMGGAGTARSYGGFAFYNPAGAATAPNSFVGFEYGQQWGDLTRGLVEGVYIFPRWFFGASFQTQGISFPITDDLGNDGLGNGAAQESQFTLLTGFHRERYAIGIAANGLQQHIYNADAFALSASGGVTVSILPGKLAAGFALLHAGRLHRGFDQDAFTAHRDTMPTTARIGSSWNDTLFGKLPVTLQIDAVYSSNYSQLMVPVGIEFRPVAPLAIRIGKRFNHPSDILSCGIGVYWENLSYNLAFVPTNIGEVDLKWLMGLTYSLAKRKPHVPKTAGQKLPPAPAEITTVPDSKQPDHPADIIETPATVIPNTSDSTSEPTDTTVTATPDDSLNATAPGQSLNNQAISGIPQPPADRSSTTPEAAPAAPLPLAPAPNAAAATDDATQPQPKGATVTPPADTTAPQR